MHRFDVDGDRVLCIDCDREMPAEDNGLVDMDDDAMVTT